METKICGIPGGGRWVLLDSGMGGFLNPPGDAEHSWSVAEYRGSRSRDYETCSSLRGALAESWVPAPVQAKCRALLAAHTGECTEEWLTSVYGYFRSCYSPDGVDRTVSTCLIVKPNPNGFGYVVGPFGKDGWLEELPSPERHLAVLFVRRFFPDHEPRIDLIESGGQWGKATS